MKKHYCSVETCLALKELGFNEYVDACYGTDFRHNGESIGSDEEFELKCEGRGDEIVSVPYGAFFLMPCRNSDKYIGVAAPTVNEAIDWLRDAHNVVVTTEAFGKGRFGYVVRRLNDDNGVGVLTVSDEKEYKEFYKASEAGIFAAVNKMKEKK